MAYIPCDEYIGETVYLIFYDSVGLEWVKEEVEVLSDPYGMIYRSIGLDVDQPYWIGKTFESSIKTLPLVAPTETGKKSRINDISLYVAESSGGSLVVDGEEILFEGFDNSKSFTGKVSAPYSGKYEDEPQIEISTNEIYNLRILAIEQSRRQYER